MEQCITCGAPTKTKHGEFYYCDDCLPKKNESMKELEIAIKHLKDYRMILMEEYMSPNGLINDQDQKELNEMDEAISTLKVLSGAKTPVKKGIDLDRVDHEFALEVN